MRLSTSALAAGALSMAGVTGIAHAQATAEPVPQAALWLSSERTAADNSGRGGFALPALCRTKSDETSGFLGLLGFAFNFLFTEVADAISAAERRRVEALTDEFGAVRNYRLFAPEASSTQRDCLIVEQRADQDANSPVRSLIVFAIEPIGDTAIALQPVLARVNETPVNRRARNPNVNVQVGLSLNALVGGNCAASEPNCAPAKPVVLGNSQFSFDNLTPGQSWVCTAAPGDQNGCGKMSGQSAAIVFARPGTPTTIGAAVTVTSVTLANAVARQEMWERHREALIEALNGVVGDIGD